MSKENVLEGIKDCWFERQNGVLNISFKLAVDQPIGDGRTLTHMTVTQNQLSKMIGDEAFAPGFTEDDKMVMIAAWAIAPAYDIPETTMSQDSYDMLMR